MQGPVVEAVTCRRATNGTGASTGMLRTICMRLEGDVIGPNYALHRRAQRLSIPRQYHTFEGAAGWYAFFLFVLQVLAMLGLPVTARDVASLMRRFSETHRGEVFFLYPRLLQSVAGGERRRKSGEVLPVSIEGLTTVSELRYGKLHCSLP